MYILMIDPSVRDNITITDAVGVTKTYPYKNRDMLVAVDEFLTEQEKTPKEIEGMAVLLGVGSFTATRLAVTLVNTWGYVLNIPVIGVREADWHKEYIEKELQQTSVGQYIHAKYSGVPHIG
ncbi:hypothetical protein KKG22_02215 [Patescibacteria group bacterium]|nr:hypothetical protein [Patescibacteria group bacterium]MBU1721833.1 hypothetical protein [Patescibacteria group bacterium]MBU1901672.1 hypothetical protein [Patescibacteria group bacterium]